MKFSIKCIDTEVYGVSYLVSVVGTRLTCTCVDECYNRIAFVGFNANPINYNNSNGGPASMSTMSQIPINAVAPTAAPQALQVNLSSANAQINGHNFPQNVNMLPPQQDFGKGR